MGKIHRITENEKKLLNAVGKNPHLSMKELLVHTTYAWERTVKRKLAQLKEEEILMGPHYDINYTKLSRNPLHKLYCIIETDQSYETVITYLQVIDSIRVIFPVLSPHKRVLTIIFFSSDDKETTSLLQILKDNNIITDYIARSWCSKRMVENPNLFGDSNPSLEGLLNPCDIPDMSLPCYDTEWSECDIKILPYLQWAFKGSKLIEILREERKSGRTWRYDQIKYSREKMLHHNLIEKVYFVHPFHLNQCTQFDLFVNPVDNALTQRILTNFAKGARVYKEYVLCEEGGFLFCFSHPSFLKDLMHNLDHFDEIREREVYPVRGFPYGKYFFSRPMTLDYYDVDTQTLEYPYTRYKEKIKEKIEGHQ